MGPSVVSVAVGATVKHRSDARREPSRPNLRRVYLVQRELFDEVSANGFAIGADDIGENVVTAGVDPLGLQAGPRLHLGAEAVVELICSRAGWHGPPTRSAWSGRPSRVGRWRRREASRRAETGASALLDDAQPLGLSRAGARAFGLCSDTVAAVLELQGPVDPERQRALTVATWSLVHGLALLVIDEQVPPDLVPDGRDALIGQVLGAFGAVFR